MKTKSIIVAILLAASSAFAQVTVTISASGPTTFCTGSSVQLNSSVSPQTAYQYQWLKNGNNITQGNSSFLNVNASGLYQLKITTLSNISYFSNSLTINVNPLPTAPTLSYSSPALICKGSTTNLSDNLTTNASFQWYKDDILINGANSNIYTANSKGKYMLKITSVSTGCTNNSPNIFVGEMPNFEFDSIVSCGDSINLNLINTNNSYSVIPESCVADMADTGTFSATAFINSTITINNQIEKAIVCYGGVVNYSGGGGHVFLINKGGTVNRTGAGGSQTYYVKSGGIFNNTGQTGGGNTLYFEPGALINNSGGMNTIIQCNNIGVIYPSNTVGCDNLNYQWSNGATTSSIKVNPSTTTPYSVTVSNSLISCSDQIIINPTATAPFITANGSITFCQGGSVVLTSSSANGNTWSNGATTQSITVTNSGSFSVTVAYGNCTSTSVPTLVTVNPISNCCTSTSNSITPDGPTTFCAGNYVYLTSNVVGGTYQWKKNGVNITTNGTSRTYKATANGSYTCEATCNGSVLTSNAIAVTSKTNASAAVTASGATSFCLGDSVTLNCTNLGSSYSVQWYRTNISMENATAYSQVVKQPGTYKVVTKNLTTGCSRISSSSAIVAVSCRLANPNVIVSDITESDFAAKGINEEPKGKIYIYPNPTADNKFTVELMGLEIDGNATLEVYNAMGQLLSSEKVNITNGTLNRTIQINEQSRGQLCLVRLMAGSEVYDSKVILK